MDPNQDRAVQAAFDGYISGADHAEALAAAEAKGYKAGLRKAAEMAWEMSEDFKGREAKADAKGDRNGAYAFVVGDTVASALAFSLRALAEK